MNKYNKTTGVTITVDPPRHLSSHLYGRLKDGAWGRLLYGTPEWFSAYEEKLDEWAKEFQEFIRDHRSQDPVCMNVEREEAECCSACHEEYEAMIDEDGHEACAYCGEKLEAVNKTKAG